MAWESDVREFREAFRLPISDRPTILSEEENKLHLTLIEEELNELMEAMVKKDLVGVFDAIVDLRYVLMGLAVHMGLPMEEGERVVHASNMSKLDENGEPIFREDGKVLKSDLWWKADPHLEALVEQCRIAAAVTDLGKAWSHSFEDLKRGPEEWTTKRLKSFSEE